MSVDADLRSFLQLGCYAFPAVAELDALRRSLRSAAMEKMPYPEKENPTRLSKGEIESVRQALLDDETGKAELYSVVDANLCGCLVAYYLAETNRVPDRARLALARCFGRAGNLTYAAKLAQEYVRAFPDDWRGWKILGLSCYKGMSYAEGYSALAKAINLGTTNAVEGYPSLAACGMMSGHAADVANLTPKLLALHADTRADPVARGDALAQLIYYAVAAGQRDLFVKALKEVNPEQLLARPTARTLFFIGHGFFQAKEVEPLWQAYRKAAWEEEPKHD
jgi:hypothetical protein